jgi:hypothetical protein
MDPALALSPEIRERIRKNTGNFLLALKVLLACLIMVRFYKLGQMANRRRVVADAKASKAAAKGKAADAAAAGKPDSGAGKASAAKRRAKAT